MVKTVRVTLVCQECGRIFRVRPTAADPRCPKCHGVDWEVQ
jgi:Zn finger protein HypA/HybF involved in hydrogenase expression